jgi:predicted homoserine dehydrogenase-like protein
MLRERLAERARAGAPIRVGVVGAGRFGTMVLCQLASLPGMHPAAVADVDLARGQRALREAGVSPDDIVETDRPSRMVIALGRGSTVLTQDAGALVQSDVDVVVEATGVPEAAVTSALGAIAHGKHVVMVTVEADVLVGAVLRKRAEQAGVVYTAAYGDQPALVEELYDWATSVGFQVVAAGKGTKYHPSYRKGTPQDVWERYGLTPEEARDLNPQMYNSFTDGTKSAIEMAAVANMTGLRPDVRGMHIPPAGVEMLPEVFKPVEEGGILTRTGVVDVASSIDREGRPVPHDLRWGVFVVITSACPYTRRCLREYGLPVDSTGRYAAFYRPYHLVGLELPLSIARAVLDRQPTGAPLLVPQATVVCAAKRSLRAGDVLDGEGGTTVYGVLDEASAAKRERLLPIALSRGARLLRAVPEDGLVRLDDVALPGRGALHALWEEQMALVPDA